MTIVAADPPQPGSHGRVRMSARGSAGRGLWRPLLVVLINAALLLAALWLLGW